METRLRLVIVFGGLPRPRANIDIFDEYGQWVGRPDLQYTRERITIQYEGKQHRTDQRRYEQDILRVGRLGDLGWVVLRVTATDVYRRPATVVERVRYHLAKRGAAA
jgi:very-short-patch-repair endonuclease